MNTPMVPSIIITTPMARVTRNQRGDFSNLPGQIENSSVAIAFDKPTTAVPPTRRSILSVGQESPILAISRAFASGAHYCEEIEREEPMKLGQSLSPKEDYDGPADRPVPPLSERAKSAKPGVTYTPEDWKKGFVEKQKLNGSGWAIVEEIDDPRRKI